MSNTDPKTVEVICTLSDQAFRERRDWVRQHIATPLIAIDDLSDGFQLVFSDDPDTTALVEEFAALERQCCGSFLQFAVSNHPNVNQTRLQITGPAQAQALLGDLKQRFYVGRRL